MFRAACFAKSSPGYTPRTNGKAERFIQTALREWAYARAYHNSDQRSDELMHWLHRYNWHRPHGSLKANTPISRLGGQPVEAPHLAKPSPIGSFGIVSNAPVTGPKKEFTIGVNDWRWHNLKRCGGFHRAAKSTESGRRDGTRIVRAVED